MKCLASDLKTKIISTLLALLFWTNICRAVTGTGMPLTADNQQMETCRLEQAEELYYAGEFDQALLIIEDCLTNHSPAIPVQIHALTILTRIYLARGERTAAEQNITKILDLDPAFEPSIEEETPKFVNFVAEIRQKAALSQTLRATVESDSSHISPWIWLGAGGAALAIFAILSTDNGGISLPTVNDQRLPAPPAFPND